MLTVSLFVMTLRLAVDCFTILAAVPQREMLGR